MRLLARSLIAVFLLAVTAGLLVLAAHTVLDALAERRDAPPALRAGQERIFAVPVVAVTPETVAPVLETFGEIRARRTLELRAPAAGRVIWRAEGLEDGAAVEAGQLLLRVDPADAQAARDLAAADLDRAEAERRDAERALALAAEDLAAAEEQEALRARALERSRDLATRGAATEATVEAAELALSAARQASVSRALALAQAEGRRDQADTALARQRIALAEAERRLADTEIFAPFAGRLAEVAVTEGGLIASGERLGKLIDPAALEVSFRISTAQYARLIDEDAGVLLPLPVTATLDVMGAEIAAQGRLDRVGAAVGEGQSGRLLHAALEAPRGFLPGDFVTLRVTEPPLEAVARLPARAVDADGRVLVVGADDRLAEAEVEVLRRQGAEVLVAAPGLAGAEVVAARTPLLGAGIRIRPVRPDEAEREDAAAPASAAPAAADDNDDHDTVALSDDRRAELIARIEGNSRMPAEARARLIAQLSAERVPAALVARLDARLDARPAPEASADQGG